MAMRLVFPNCPASSSFSCSRSGHHHRVWCSASSPLPPATVLKKGAVDWKKATSHFFESDTRPIMLFDGVCNLCNGGVKFVRDNDHNRRIRYEALQSESGRKLLQRSGRSPDDISSVVLVEKDRSYIKSEAVLKIMEYLDMPFPQLSLFIKLIPLFMRDTVYDTVANNRYAFFGRSDACEI
ncbi:DCC family protein At1g52590, chloroplastic isoform X1 [Nymphaea colorata]|nr:DCC family protein At1g52590, chloroplastic isoform X1 [Nymphaea colorata]